MNITHIPLVSEPFLSEKSEFLHVGRGMVCNESTAVTWLSCKFSETKTHSSELCRSFQYAVRLSKH
jgi:hypothetical protein